MISIRPPLPAVVLALALLVAGSSARTQATSEPLAAAASAQSIQQQLDALKAQVASLQASVTGGQQNIASGQLASVTGGMGNTAGGLFTVVLGTHNVTDSNSNAVAPGVAP